jgi:hypothetical protein
MKAHHKERMAIMRPYWRETKACPEKLEAIPEDIESESDHQEILKEEAAVKPFGALKKRHGDWNLSVGRRQKPKERSQDNGGSRNKLAAACKGTTCRAGVARNKGHSRQRQGQDDKVQGTSKWRTLGTRRREQPECNNGISERGLEQQVPLRSKWAFN